MTKQEVLDSLKNFSSVFPKEAFKEVQTNRENYTQELLDSLDYSYQNATELTEKSDDYFFHNHAMFLLAEFREKRAFPYLTAILNLPNDELDFILGETLTEDFHKILVSTFDDTKIQLLFDVIENSDLDEYARTSALKAYSLLYQEGFIDKENFISYLRSLIYDKLSDDDDVEIFTTISDSVIDSKIFEMILDVRFLYDDDRIDLRVNGAYDEFIDYLFREKRPEESPYIYDAFAEVSGWGCFEQDNETEEKSFDKDGFDKILEQMKKEYKNNVPKQIKIGRNEPCPCDSGKKYKNCCYALHQQKSDEPKETEDLLKDYPTDSELFKEMYEEEAINIDMFVYKALHRKNTPIWVKRDWNKERDNKVWYLSKALELFIDKCQREQITTFKDYDERFMIHYASHEWLAILIDLIDSSDYDSVKEHNMQTAKDIVSKFS